MTLLEELLRGLQLSGVTCVDDNRRYLAAINGNSRAPDLSHQSGGRL
jgi:hypothetical protein